MQVWPICWGQHLNVNIFVLCFFKKNEYCLGCEEIVEFFFLWGGGGITKLDYFGGSLWFFVFYLGLKSRCWVQAYNTHTTHARTPGA